jgi:hypothetical protein
MGISDGSGIYYILKTIIEFVHGATEAQQLLAI